MSNCIISIKIGDQVITLDPNSNISEENKEILANSIDVNKLRALYSNLKGEGDFSSTLNGADIGKSKVGEELYDKMVDLAKMENPPRYLTPFAALKEAKFPSDREALSSYIATLNPTAVHPTGNFLDDMKNSYMLSPYSQSDIRSLVFNTGRSKTRALEIFDQLLNIPGMETTRISIAYANYLHNNPSKPITTIQGAYISPDNIIQILLPLTPEYREESDNIDGVSKANIPKKVLNELQGKVLHELTHAVYTELLRSDPSFYTQMKSLHDRFVKLMSEQNVPKLHQFATTYKNIDEFTADVLSSPRLQEQLGNIISQGIGKDKNVYLHETLGSSPLYKFLISSLPGKLQKNASMLKDVLSLMSDRIPKGDLVDTLQRDREEFAGMNNKQSIFFTPEEEDDGTVNAFRGPKDQTDTHWTVNAEAFRVQKQYLDRVTNEDGQSAKDAYYGTNIDSPAPYQVDLLYKHDLVLIPWLRYNRIEGQAGAWVEQGVAVKNKVPVMEGSQMKVVDIVRDKNGKIVQDPALGYEVEERFRHVPVLFANAGAKTVRVAKVGLDPEKVLKPGYDGYNSLNIPYEFVKGIRKYNWEFFDHNHDYNADLEQAKASLRRSNTNSDGPQAKYDNVDFWEKQITRIEKKVTRAEEMKQDLIDLHNKYAFNVTQHEGEDKTYVKNITEADYKLAGFDKKWGTDNIVFATPETAAFVMQKTAKGYMSKPNPRNFLEIWQDEAGKEFAKTSAFVAEAVTKGDLVRVHSTITEVKNGEKITIHKNDWLPVYQKLPNGVLVGTMYGKGLIVPFSKIDSYAKNRNTESYKDLVEKQANAIDTFKENMYTTGEDNKKKSNKEFVKYRPINPDTEIDPKGDQEEEDDSITRFTSKKLDYIRSIIKPGESFVKIMRMGYSSDPTEKVKPYQAIELVMAHTDTGLYTFRETQDGKHVFGFTSYKDMVDPKEQGSKQLLFLLEDVSDVSKQWKDYISERETFETNADRDLWVKDGKSWIKAFDPREEARNYRDVYDFYENPTSRSISKLQKGDVVAIKMDLGAEGTAKSYFRKVLRVLEDGRVAVAENRAKDIKFKNGGVGKAGLFVKYIHPEDLAKVGYRIGKVEGDKDTGFTSEFHQDILDRRAKLLEYSLKDLDWNDFQFKGAKEADTYNNKHPFRDGGTTRYVPLTSYILDPKTGDREVYLDKNLEVVSQDKAAYVKAWFKGEDMINAVRGVNANSITYKAEHMLVKNGKYLQLHPDVAGRLMPGDWVVTKYKDKNGKDKQWASTIDRVENGRIYKINPDLTTSPVFLDKITSIKTAYRNYRFDKTRSEVFDALVKEKVGNKKIQSLDLPFKSSADSRRALMEIGNRLQELNPDIKLHYANSDDINDILKATKHDYTQARAFVMNGEVYINMNKASVSDVVHEYAHLFLHTLKYENSELYNAIVESTNKHSLYDTIAQRYQHLDNRSDLNEEVFVTLLGEYMKGSMNQVNKGQMDVNKYVIEGFADYTATKLSVLLKAEQGDLYAMSPSDILNMRMEDVIGMVGDHVMQNRISAVYDEFKSSHDVDELKRALRDKGILTHECYG